MENCQKFNFLSKKYRWVASGPEAAGPWHRITLRVGMKPSCSTSHCKLIFIQIWRVFAIFLKMSLKRLEKFKFSKKNWKCHFFRVRENSFVRIFTCPIMFQSKFWAYYEIRHKKLLPENVSNQNLNAWKIVKISI